MFHGYPQAPPSPPPSPPSPPQQQQQERNVLDFFTPQMLAGLPTGVLAASPPPPAFPPPPEPLPPQPAATHHFRGEAPHQQASPLGGGKGFIRWSPQQQQHGFSNGGGRGGGRGGGKGYGQMPLYQQAPPPPPPPPPPAQPPGYTSEQFPLLGSAKQKPQPDASTLTVVTRAPTPAVAAAAAPAAAAPHAAVAIQQTRFTPPARIVAASKRSYKETAAKSLREKEVREKVWPARGLWYSRELWQACRGSMLAHLQSLERAFADMIRTGTRSKMLPPMNREKRGTVHELASYYNITVVSMDKEPKRSCFLKLSAASFVPRQILSDWCKNSMDPDTQAEQRLRSHPHLALVFPSVPASVLHAKFNAQLSPQAGKVLVLFRKTQPSGAGPVRDVIAVFFTEKACMLLCVCDLLSFVVSLPPLPFSPPHLSPCRRVGEDDRRTPLRLLRHVETQGTCGRGGTAGCGDHSRH